jgi:hypothetical protein
MAAIIRKIRKVVKVLLPLCKKILVREQMLKADEGVS